MIYYVTADRKYVDGIRQRQSRSAGKKKVPQMAFEIKIIDECEKVVFVFNFFGELEE